MQGRSAVTNPTRDGYLCLALPRCGSPRYNRLLNRYTSSRAGISHDCIENCGKKGAAEVRDSCAICALALFNIETLRSAGSASFDADQSPCLRK